MNLRGQCTTDAQGKIWFDTIKPSGYPVPVNGVVGDWLRAQGRHNMRPVHLHFLIAKVGYKTQFAQVYDGADANLETDSQFRVTTPLVGAFVRHCNEVAPNGMLLPEWYSLTHTLVVLPDCLPCPARRFLKNHLIRSLCKRFSNVLSKSLMHYSLSSIHNKKRWQKMNQLVHLYVNLVK
jgi:Dioxygenase